MLISVIIPALNEEAYIGETHASLARAVACLREREAVSAEVIVVDDGSADSTARVARGLGATVITEARHNVAKARNTGADSAGGDVLVFFRRRHGRAG